MESRTRKSALNVLFSEMSYAIILVLQFASRSIFIRLLPAEYLGMNGLFSNVLSFLSLAELGIGAAINYALYRPLKEKDTETLKSLMTLYRRLYTGIGILVLVTGSALAPFLPFLIKDMPEDIPGIYLYFLMYLLNSGLSYFCTYKRALIVCDQKQYITTFIAAVSGILLKGTQIIVLLVFRSFGAYLGVMIVMTMLDNLVVSAVAGRMYPYLKEKDAKKPDPEIAREIRKNVYALVFQKIGDSIVYATDNIIISKFVGFAAVGLYSNYTLVVQAVQTAANRFFDALTASIGNLVVTDEKEHVEEILYRILFINAWMFSFCSICLLCLVQPFIRLWIGPQFLLPDGTLFLMILQFYLAGMRATAGTFRRAMGLFWYVRYKPMVEGILNLAVSIPLAIRFGIAGTLMGTIISTFFMSSVAEPYGMFRIYFQKGFLKFLLTQIQYGMVTIGAGLLTSGICRWFTEYTPEEFVIRMAVCALVPNICMILVYRKNEHYRFFLETLCAGYKKAAARLKKSR